MKKGNLFPLASYHAGKMMIEYTGEKRPPKRGEWFLSGAIVEGYQAMHDMTTSYHIGVLVETETITVKKRTL